MHTLDSLWYIRNRDLYQNFKMETVDQTAKKFAVSHAEPFRNYVNIKIIQFLDTTRLERKLNRKKTFELA